jgi:hypothetical protein
MTSDSDGVVEHTVEPFGATIIRAMRIAASVELLCNTSPNIPTRVLLADAYHAVAVAEPGIQRYLALRTLNSQKKLIKQKKTIAPFAAHGLMAPRDDESVANSLPPLLIDGKLTFDACRWETEFRTLFSGLFTDSENDFGTKDARLERLRLESLGESRIILPRFIPCDILSQSDRKRTTAPGLDGITWGALGC